MHRPGLIKVEACAETYILALPIGSALQHVDAGYILTKHSFIRMYSRVFEFYVKVRGGRHRNTLIVQSILLIPVYSHPPRRYCDIVALMQALRMTLYIVIL